MKPEVVKKLIEKGAIKRSTTIEADFRSRDMAGDRLARVRGNLLVLGARLLEDQVILDAVEPDATHRKHTVTSEGIIAIDGMDPERFANIFGLTEDGEPLRQGKRRGRKPKAVKEKEAAEQAKLEQAQKDAAELTGQPIRKVG